MTDEEIQKALEEAEANGGPVPTEIEEKRKPIEASSGAAAIVCCKYYAGMGQYRYARMSKQTCTSFPINGTVVSDSYCR